MKHKPRKVRVSSGGPNHQTIPRDEEGFRDIETEAEFALVLGQWACMFPDSLVPRRRP